MGYIYIIPYNFDIVNNKLSNLQAKLLYNKIEPPEGSSKRWSFSSLFSYVFGSRNSFSADQVLLPYAKPCYSRS